MAEPHILRTAAALPPPPLRRSAAQRQWPSGGGPREWPAPARQMGEINGPGMKGDYHWDTEIYDDISI